MKKNTKKLCKCCQTSLQGKFCWKCGQQDINENAPFFEYVKDTLDENFGLNGTIVKTIKTLMTKPGHLTKLYSQGIRTGYVKPAKLLLTMTIFFVLFNSFFDISEVKFLGTFNPTTFVPETITGSYSMEECESSQTNVKALYQEEYNQKFQTLIQTAFNDETITYQLNRMMRGYIWGAMPNSKSHDRQLSLYLLEYHSVTINTEFIAF